MDPGLIRSGTPRYGSRIDAFVQKRPQGLPQLREDLTPTLLPCHFLLIPNENWVVVWNYLSRRVTGGCDGRSGSCRIEPLVSCRLVKVDPGKLIENIRFLLYLIHIIVMSLFFIYQQFNINPNVIRQMSVAFSFY